MKCPACNVDLVMADRQGVEIDYCPKCRGVWLDRGELDKIIERAAPAEPAPAPPPPDYRGSHPGYHYGEGGEGGHYYGEGGEGGERGRYYGRRRRKSFLSDIFDFD
jgi:Zn-finger nucleic acid-binding protein